MRYYKDPLEQKAKVEDILLPMLGKRYDYMASVRTLLEYRWEGEKLLLTTRLTKTDRVVRLDLKNAAKSLKSDFRKPVEDRW